MKTHQPYLDWIENEHDAMMHLTEKWARINSASDNSNGLQTMLKVLSEDFKALNGRQTTLSFPPRKAAGEKGRIKEQCFGQALSIKKRPEAPVQIFFGGHMDTVYPLGSPGQEVVRENDRLKGPGTADMKGGLVILLKALEALERSPEADSVGWEILINADEEIGSPGSKSYLIEAAKSKHAGLLFEPSLPDGSFIDKRKGSANFTLIVRGRAAHSGRDFHSGRNAIYALADLIRKTENITDGGRGITVNVGYVEGGGPVNIVPDVAVCKINIRAPTPEDMRDAHEKITEIANSAKSRDGISCTLFEDSSRLPKLFDEKNKKLFRHYEQCCKRLGIPFHLRESGGACDGNILSAAGLPVIDSLGARGDKIHTPEEYILSESLVERARLTALFLLEVASGNIVLQREGQ